MLKVPLDQQPPLTLKDDWYDRVLMEGFFNPKEATHPDKWHEQTFKRALWFILAIDGNPGRSRRPLDPIYADAVNALVPLFMRKLKQSRSKKRLDQLDFQLFKQLTFSQVLGVFAPGWVAHHAASQPGRRQGSKEVGTEKAEIRACAADLVRSKKFAKCSTAVEAVGLQRGMRKNSLELRTFKKTHERAVRRLVGASR